MEGRTQSCPRRTAREPLLSSTDKRGFSLMADFGGIPRLRAGRLGLQQSTGLLPRALGSNPTLFYANNPRPVGQRLFVWRTSVGFDLRCGGGRVAALASALPHLPFPGLGIKPRPAKRRGCGNCVFAASAPRRRKAAIPPAPHSLPLPFESPSGMQKGMTARRTVIPFWLKIAISTK